MRAKWYTYPIFAAVLVSAVSCRHSYRLEGSVDLYGYDGESLYLVTHENDEFVAVDSCVVRHGRFRMGGTADSSVFAVLCHDFNPILPLFIERGNMTVSIAPSKLNVNGTKLNNLLYEFLDRKNEIDNRFEDVLQRSQQVSNIMDPAVSFTDSLTSVVREAEDYIYGFVKKHYDDGLGVCVFLMMCNAAPQQEPSPLVKRIIENAPERFISNPKVRDCLVRIGYPGFE